MRETSPEVCTIDINLSGLGNVNFFAAWTVHFETGRSKLVSEAHWECLLAVTKSTRAGPVHANQELVVNLGDASRSVDKSSVKQSVQV